MTLKGLRRAIITGAVLLLPLVAVVYFLAQLFLLGVKVATPVIDLFGIERARGFVLVNLAALGLVLGLCLLAGLAARLPAVTLRIRRLDRALERRIPGYSMVVAAFRGAVGEDAGVDQLRVVLVAAGGGRRIGFEVERAAGRIVVFLPNAPHPQTGIAMSFPENEVEPAGISSVRALEILQFYGRGLAALPKAAGSEGPRAGT